SIGDLLVDYKTLGGDAGLAVVNDPCFDGSRDRLVEVRAGHHDKWVAAAQFENNFLDSFGSRHADLNAGSLAPGKSGGSNTRIIQNAVNFPCADEERLKDNLRKGGVTDELVDLQRALRHIGSGF